MLEVYLDKVTKGLNISQIKLTGRRYAAQILPKIFYLQTDRCYAAKNIVKDYFESRRVDLFLGKKNYIEYVSSVGATCKLHPT
jgi:hypothetical protein